MTKSPVNLQNGVRLRIIVVFAFSIFINLFVPLTSDAVGKAISIIGANSYFYFLVLLCSLIPSKVAWMVAIMALVAVSVLDLVVLFLGLIVTVRCLSEGGCIQTLPFSLIVLGLLGLLTLLDLYQAWTVYLILQTKTYIASATQRLRVVLTWAVPFAFLVNFAMAVNGEYSVMATPPLIALPIVIYMAHQPEGTFLGLLLVITLISIAITFISVQNSLAISALMIEGILSAFGLLLLFMPNEWYTSPSVPPPPDIHILPSFVIEKTPVPGELPSVAAQSVIDINESLPQLRQRNQKSLIDIKLKF